jgi:hypothetical protein
VNLADFGAPFARESDCVPGSVPNPYGPILFQLHPAALLEASDVAVCLCSAGAKGFDREREALKSIHDTDRLFLYSSQAPYPEKTYVKFRDELKQEFGGENIQKPEVSCTVPEGTLSLKHVAMVLVDPYILNDKPLREWVNQIKVRYRAEFPVHQRRCSSKAVDSLYNEIAGVIVDRTPTLMEIAHSPGASRPLQDWASRIMGTQLEWQFRRFANYLREGTLLALSDEMCSDTAASTCFELRYP